MKPLYWLILAIPFLPACKKDGEGDPVFNISGILMDAQTGKPIPGITLTTYSVDASWTGESAEVQHAFGITGPDGRFSIEFNKTELHTSGFEWVFLGCNNIPANYQNHVKVNSGTVAELYFNYNDNFTNFIDILQVLDNQSYSLYLYPQAHFYFKIPPLTPELAQDTVRLNLWTSRDYFPNYALGNAGSVQSLKRVREIWAADRATGTFELRRGGLIKRDTFDVFCPPNDTVAVFLDL